MKDKILTVVTLGKDYGYVREFEKLISEKSLSLSCPQLKNLCPKEPIIGHVMNDYLGYEKALSMSMLEAIDDYRGLWLVVRHLNDKYGLGVGSVKNAVEIFQENHGVNRDRYFLSYDIDTPLSGKSSWIEVTQDFRKKTFNLLAEWSKKEFGTLVKNSS